MSDEKAQSPFLNFNSHTRFIVSTDQLASISQVDMNLPPEVCQGFWTPNTHNQRLMTPSDRLLITYCPLLIGPLCSPIRRHDFIRILMLFSFWLILGQIAIFIYLMLNTVSPNDIFTIDRYLLIKFGEICPSKIRYDYQFWRFLSTIVLHKRVCQLIINVFLELVLVIPREANWKFYRLVPVLILSSIFGNLCTLIFNTNTISVGPSCGIFGVFGSFIISYIVLVSKLIWKHRIGVLIMMLFILILLIFAGIQDGSDNIGNAGGFIYGAAFGMVLFANKQEDRKRVIIFYSIGGFLSIAMPIILSLVFWFKPRIIENDLC